MTDRPLQTIQYGVEGDATPGTLVAATRRLGGGTVNWEAIDTDYDANHPSGIYTMNPIAPVPLLRGVDLSYDGDLTIDEMIDFAQMSLGEQAPSGVGPYDWDFEPSEAAAPDVRTYTFERRLTGSTGPYDVEAGFVAARGWTITQNLNEQTRLTVDMFGRRVQPSTLTPALPVPALTLLAANHWTCFIDNEATAHGTTQILGQLRSFEVVYKSGQFPKYFIDARGDLDFSSIGTGPRGIESLRMQIEWAGQAETERTAARAGDMRMIRLRAARGTEHIELDMVMRHTKPDFLSVSDADGNDVVDLEFKPAYDSTPVATYPNHFEMKIRSDARATL